MEDLKILQEGINHLSKAIEEFSECDLVSQEEYDKLVQFIEELENRKINKEIQNESYYMEVI